MHVSTEQKLTSSRAFFASDAMFITQCKHMCKSSMHPCVREHVWIINSDRKIISANEVSNRKHYRDLLTYHLRKFSYATLRIQRCRKFKKLQARKTSKHEVSSRIIQNNTNSNR